MKAAGSIGKNSPDDLRSFDTTSEISRAAPASIVPSLAKVRDGDRHRLDIALGDVELNHRVCHVGAGAGADDQRIEEAAANRRARRWSIEEGDEVGHGFESLLR